MKILVVDDDLEEAYEIQQSLNDDEVVIELDGSSGLARVARAQLERTPFDVVLCNVPHDAMLVEIAKALRECHVPPMIILLSDRAVEASSSIDGILIKPFDVHDLRVEIARTRLIRSRAITRPIGRAAAATP